MQILDFSTANAQISDEIINVPDSNPVNLGHSAFYNKTGKKVVISTAAGGGGTVLTETTDWTSGGAYSDSDLPASITPDVAYSTLSIVNATYHDTDLYVSYYPLGDNINADLWNNQNIPPFFGSGPYDISATDVTIDLSILDSLPAGKVQIVAAYGGDGSNTLSFTDNGETINDVSVADWVIEGTGELWLMKKSDGNFWAVNPGEVWDSDGGAFTGYYFEKTLHGKLRQGNSVSASFTGTTAEDMPLNFVDTSYKVLICIDNTTSSNRSASYRVTDTNTISIVVVTSTTGAGSTGYVSYEAIGRWTTSNPRKTA